MIETWIQLKPQSEWRPGMTPDELVDDLNARLRMPGLVNSWGYPINIRMDMVSTGVRTPVGIKITGDNLVELERLAREVEAAVSAVPGTRAALADRVLGGNYLEILPDRAELARRNIDMGVFPVGDSDRVRGDEAGRKRGRARALRHHAALRPPVPGNER